MFRRYPYWGWLSLSILLWFITGFRYFAYRQQTTPQHMVAAVAKDLHNRERRLRELMKDTALVQKLFLDSMANDDEAYLQKMPFLIFAYSRDTLTFWNTNKILGKCTTRQPLIHYERGVFVQRCFTTSAARQQQVTILIPIVTIYPIENDYLSSRFLAADYIPMSTEVLSEPSPGSYQIKDLNNIPVFYLHFHKSDIHYWLPDSLLIWLIIAAVLASVSWLQLMTIYLTRNRSYIAGLLLTVCIVVGCRALTYLFGLPFDLDAIDFFSPRLYASSIFLPSLGAVLINVLCILWLVIFVARHTPYKEFFSRVKDRRICNSIAVLFAALMIGYTYGFVNLIRSLVVDSSISFDVSRFYSISLYTILGLFTIAILTGVSCMIIYLFNIQITQLTSGKRVKYIGVALLQIVFVLLYSGDKLPLAALMAWLLLFIILLDIPQLKLVPDLFAPHMLFWALFICGFCTGILQYFNHAKERDSRLVFAEKHIAQERDVVTEYAFNNISDNIKRDHIIKLFLSRPVAFYRRAINERFEVLYLGGQLSKYQSRIYLFDKYGNTLYNKDTASFASLQQRVQSSELVDSTLFYKENAPDGHYYLAYIPIPSDKGPDIIGYAFIDLSLKQATNETVYPELLQPANIRTDPGEAEYSYAVYLNDALLTQTNDYPFPIYVTTDTLSVGNHAFYNRNSYSELWYKFSTNKTLMVVHYHNVFIEMVTLFSYMFGIEMGLAVIILLYQLYLSYFAGNQLSRRIMSLTLRRRIHFSMLGVVLVSFIIIGFVTIVFFRNEYNRSNEEKLQDAMQVVQTSVQQYMKQENGFSGEDKFDQVSRSTRFKYFITNLANSQKIDINIFNNTGVLDVTSQDDIYDRALLSRLIRPDAYYQLITLGKSILIQNEKIGTLSYLSCYVPLRNDLGAILGYINVPFFSSEKDLNSQISNIVVTLINLYAFVFLLSSLFTVFVTRWLTRTFNVIIGQFGRLNLQKNERIQWPYDDEIGALVREYNIMVEKVEANAALLAQSERESAWREMARQVAHEIKNPLTPMKLNIQYLQQALKNDQPNAVELASRVSASIIEQIDNLSYIASEFSNFAKMPEARPEDIELGDLLDKAVELYANEQDLQLHISRADDVVILADRSQLLRVFTNLLENARQAIPAQRTGAINVNVVKQDGQAIVAIEDNGVGIAPDVVKRIFQPYFTTKSSGTGLGLAMTKKIIEFWKGEIWFITNEGHGTTFYIRLPLVQKEA